MTTFPTGTVTFLFTDIEGSTRLVQSLGEDFHRVLDDHHMLMRAAIAEAGGVEVSTEGDAFFVVFTSAPAAVRAAVEMQRALGAYAWPGDVTIAVRMGLHTGEGNRAGDNYAGLDVNRAARIASAAHGGQILLSAATKALVDGAIEDARIEDLGEHRLKDIERPEQLFQLSVADMRFDFPTPRTLDARPNNLLVQLTPFVGRAKEVAEICSTVRDARLVTLTGPGGTGKTRLSLEVAAQLLLEFADGTFFVPLAPVVDPGLVASTIAGQLALTEQMDRPIVDTIKEHVRDKEMLLVVDNFEQVLDAAPLISELLRASPKLKVVVTSRAVLHIDGEHEYPVPPMAVPDPDELPPLEVLSHYDAVELFVARAVAAQPHFVLTEENASATIAICARLEGLPLALELAAARVKLLTPTEILARLERTLTFLTGGGRDRPQRQQTLRDAIAWSYELLDEAESALFRRLAMFAGGWDIEAAEAICNPGAELGTDILDGLVSLADKSLIRRFETDLGSSRFRMLVVIREFASDALAECGEREMIRRRHADHFAALLERAEPEMTGQENWPDRLELELDNLRAVLHYCLESGDARTGQFLAGRAWRFWHLRGHLAEGREWLEALLDDATGRARTAARAKALMGLGSMDYWLGDYDATLDHYEEGLEIYRELGDDPGIGDALFNLGYAAAVQHDWATAAERQDEARAIRERIGDRMGEAWAAVAGGLAATMLNDLEKGDELTRSAEAVFIELGDWYGKNFAQYVLFLGARSRGDLAGAVDNAHSYFTMSEGHGDLSGTAARLDLYADVLVRLGYHEKAVSLAAASSSIKETLGAAAPAALVDVCDPRAEAAGALPADVIEKAWAEGSAMTPEEAVSFALKEKEVGESRLRKDVVAEP